MKKAVWLVFMVMIGLRVSAQSTDTLKFAAHKKEISTFINAVNTAGLNDLFSGQPVTIFAPDNGALANALPDSLLKPSNKPVLVGLINDHVIPGKLSAKDIEALIHQNNGQAILTTLSGKKYIAKINTDRNIVLTDESNISNIIKAFDIAHGTALIFIIGNSITTKN